MPNNANYASTGKPPIGGSVFAAPAGTTLPTNATTPLSDAFKCLGYVSEDGVSNSDNYETGTIKAWGGDTVLNFVEGHTDNFGYKLLEVMNVDTLKAVYGEDNVSGDIETGITIKSNATEKPYMSWVIELVLQNDTLKRIVIPFGKVTELGEIKYSDADAIGYDVTIGTIPDEAGNTHYEYIVKKGSK